MDVPDQAPYTRFELYIPVMFTYRNRRHNIPRKLLQEFSTETTRRYGGFTQASPTHVPYRGWWIPGDDLPASFDELTHLFGLVRSDQTDDALVYFNRWKRKFEQALHQEIVLVVFYHVNVLGGFL